MLFETWRYRTCLGRLRIIFAVCSSYSEEGTKQMLYRGGLTDNIQGGTNTIRGWMDTMQWGNGQGYRHYIWGRGTDTIQGWTDTIHCIVYKGDRHYKRRGIDIMKDRKLWKGRGESNNNRSQNRLCPSLCLIICYLLERVSVP